MADEANNGKEHFKPKYLLETDHLVNKIIFSKRTKYTNNANGENMLQNLKNLEDFKVLERQKQRREDIIKKLKDKMEHK